MKLTLKHLLLIAGFVWIAAGFNIALIGVSSMTSWKSAFILIATLIVFLLFHIKVFQKTALQNTDRIKGLNQNQFNWWNFLDRKGFIIMSVMMTGGIALRASGLLPQTFIAFFYSGLGIALMIGGLTYIMSYFKEGLVCPFKKLIRK